MFIDLLVICVVSRSVFSNLVKLVDSKEISDCLRRVGFVSGSRRERMRVFLPVLSEFLSLS